MARDDFDGEWVTGGWWTYDGSGRKRVEIVGHAFDGWHRLDFDDGVLEPDPPTPLGPDGLIYQLRAEVSGFLGAMGSFLTIQEAKAWADAQAWGPVEWDKPDPA